MKKRRRFIVPELITDSSEDDSGDEEGPMREDEFLKLFQNHLRRKRQRRKIRKAPDVSYVGEERYAIC